MSENEYEVRLLDVNKEEFIEKIEKCGAKYTLDDVEIDIDTWPHLNTFAEFEGNSEEAVLNVLKLLNVDKSSITTMDVQTIYLKEGYTKEDLNNLKF